MLQQKKIAIYITGGIAAYKVATLVRLLIKQGAQVRVAMTKGATQFITPLTMQVLTKERVHLDTFDEQEPNEVQHIHLADWTDLAIVVPATANTIAKMANGIADNFVTSSLLATTAPIVVVPAMNEHMLENPATKRNLAQLAADGKIIMEPAVGFLAEGYTGKGRMPEPEEILAFVEKIMIQQDTQQLLEGKKILLTAGGTKERIDPVRYISNDSSGKMGYALAKAAALLGGEVTLISTTKALPVPIGVTVHYVESATEMHDAVRAAFSEMDIAIMVAAVSDYHVKERATQKLKKVEGQEELTLTLVKNPDILKELGHTKRPEQLVVGFAAETEHVLEYAAAKLQKKNADYIIANDVSSSAIGFNADEHQVTILSKDGQQISLEKAPKEKIAMEILTVIQQGRLEEMGKN